MPKNYLFLIAFLLVTFSYVKAQTKSTIDSYFQEIRKGKNPAIPFSLIEGDLNALISNLAPYLNDSSEAVRKKDISILKDIGLKSRQDVRRKVTFAIAQSIRKENQSAIAALRKFRKEDFEKIAVDSLLGFLKQRNLQKNELIRLIGFVGGPEAIGPMREFSDPKNSQSIRWSSLLAMARLGDVDATNSVLQRSKKLKVNDEVVNQLFPDLVYTHQKLIYDYLIEVLMSDQANCLSADNDNPTSILCGYRVMEQLALAIKDYPLELDASGDVKTNDYKKSLTLIRHWFEQNKNIYTVDNSAF